MAKEKWIEEAIKTGHLWKRIVYEVKSSQVVYDSRVCQVLASFKQVKNAFNREKVNIWYGVHIREK